MHICVYMCIYFYMYICMYVDIPVNAYMCAYVCNMDVNTCMYMNGQTDVNISAYLHVYA